MKENVLIILIAIISFIGGCFVTSIYYKELVIRGYYESGAHAIALYHKHRGNYGSKIFRDAAFKWGDPQDEEDLRKIEKIMYKTR